ncbi:integrase core domain-containing protein [Brevibacterium litoralis]|uniref:integrase core domain-containing protein n=1 Tax=Brevibacterium litoralis TaxID=3138935 RepID=UPI0032EF28EB
MSFNRPSESNDNPFKESEFRTMKYRPSYPGSFESIEKARAWVDVYVEWFNTGHHHSALGRFTPGQVHDGSWEPLCQARREVLASYHAQHPQRFRDRPRVAVPAPEVGINLHRRVGPDGAGKQKIS